MFMQKLIWHLFLSAKYRLHWAKNFKFSAPAALGMPRYTT